MSSPDLAYRPKSPEELGVQLDNANTIIDPEEGTLQPPSLSESELMAMPIEEIKQKYARRYEIYLRILRGRPRTEDGEQPATLQEDELNEIRKWLTALNSLDSYIQNHHAEDGKKKLRGKQIDVFENLRDFLEAGGQNGYVKLPTGFGKTVLFIEFIKAVNLKTIIVVPTQELVTQTEKSIRKHTPDLEAGKVYEKAKEFGRQVTIITYKSLIAQLKSGNINPADYDCLVLDEAHEALGEETRKTVEQFDCLKLGFTATPDFSTEKGVRDLLETEIHKMTLREGVESGHLCSFVNRLVRTSADISKVKQTGGELDEKQLAEAVDVASRNEVAIKIYKERFEGKLGIAYCVGVKHAEKLAGLFREAGVSAESIDGTMDYNERKEILGRYERGETKILCNADLLIMGFDEPKASVCFRLRPSKSAVVVEQSSGRVMRLDEDDPDKLAWIFDFVDMGTDESGVVLFAQVANGSFIANPNSKWGKSNSDSGTGDIKTKVPDIEIEGIEIISDEEEIMKIDQQTRLKNREKVVVYRTPESALAELEAAYQKWKALPEKKRGKLNTLWLVKNGYSTLYGWTTRTEGGISSLIARSSIELQKDFKIQGYTMGRTPESALAELEAAYQKWKALPEKERGKFSPKWLARNGYLAMYAWANKRKGGLEAIVTTASSELQKDFEKLVVVDRTPKSVIGEIETAHKKWKALPEKERGKFNSMWLIKNGYKTLYEWAKSQKGGLEAIVVAASPELQKDFRKLVMTERTPESALAELEAAYQKWKALPEKERGKFSPKWLERNSYNALYGWATREEGRLATLFATASPELQKDFEKREAGRERTPESALAELETAYKVWKVLPEKERGKFGAQWLIKNGYQALYQWANNQTGGLPALVAAVSS